MKYARKKELQNTMNYVWNLDFRSTVKVNNLFTINENLIFFLKTQTRMKFYFQTLTNVWRYQTYVKTVDAPTHSDLINAFVIKDIKRMWLELDAKVNPFEEVYENLIKLSKIIIIIIIIIFKFRRKRMWSTLFTLSIYLHEHRRIIRLLLSFRIHS